MAANTEKASAGRNLLIYSALVALVAGYTCMVWAERDEIEGFHYPTGLGDGEIYDIAANPPDPDRPMAKLGGIAYFAAAKPKRWPDRYMVKVARDDDDRHSFYATSEEIGGGILDADGGLYLKLATGEYILVSPTANAPEPPAAGE